MYFTSTVLCIISVKWKGISKSIDWGFHYDRLVTDNYYSNIRIQDNSTRKRVTQAVGCRGCECPEQHALEAVTSRQTSSAASLQQYSFQNCRDKPSSALNVLPSFQDKRFIFTSISNILLSFRNENWWYNDWNQLENKFGGIRN